MDELQFRQRAEAIYRAVLARLDAEDPDEVEAELSSGVVRIRLTGPQGAKGTYIQRVAVSSTMGPGVAIDTVAVDAAVKH